MSLIMSWKSRCVNRPPQDAVFGWSILRPILGKPMKDSIVLALCSILFLAGQPSFVCCQAVEKKPDHWLEMLRNDPRLQAKVKFEFTSRPTAAEVLATLQKATGVRLSLAGQDEKGVATFGAMAGSSVPAWRMLEILAVSQVTDGKWVKAGDGYVLHGGPKDFGMAVLSPEAVKEEAAKTKAHEELRAKAKQAAANFAKYHPLGADLKLRVRLTVVEKHPKLQ